VKCSRGRELLCLTVVKKRGMKLTYPYVAPYKRRRRRSSSALLWSKMRCMPLAYPYTAAIVQRRGAREQGASYIYFSDLAKFMIVIF
jgi:hypothetical protein